MSEEKIRVAQESSTFEEETVSPTTLRPVIYSDPEHLVCFDKGGIRKFLGLPPVEEEKNQARSHHKGPGQISKWDALAGDTQCFIRKTTQQTTPRKKVLICHALLKDKPPTQPDLALFSELVKECDVYLLKSLEQDLRTTQPLNHPNQLWDNLDHIHPATESQARALLQDLSMSQKDWIILDLAKYNKGWGLPTEELDFTKIDLVTEEYFFRMLASVDPLTITSIKLYNPSKTTLERIFKHFPALNTLTLENFSEKWLQENLDDLEAYPQLNKLVLVTKLDIKKLHIRIRATSHLRTIQYHNARHTELNINSELNETFTVETNTDHPVSQGKIKHIILKKTEIPSISPMHEPKHLELNSESLEESQELIHSGYYKDILSLVIHGVFIPEDLLNLPIHFPNLKSLNLTLDGDDYSSDRWILPNLPYLESLSISEIITGITLGDYPNLSYLCAVSPTLILQKPFPSLRIGKFHSTTFISPISKFFHYFNKIENAQLSLYASDPTKNSTAPEDCFSVDTLVMADSVKDMTLDVYQPRCKIKTGKNLRTLAISGDPDSVIDIDVSASLNLSLLKDWSSNPNLSHINILGSEHCPKLLVKFTGKKASDVKQSDDKKRHPPLESKQSVSIDDDEEDCGLTHFSPTKCSIPEGSFITKTTIYEENAKFSALLQKGNGKEVCIDDYHIEYFDRIAYDKKRDLITFRTSAVSAPPLTLCIPSASHPKALGSRPKHIDVSYDKGFIKGTLTVGEYYPLPLTAPVTDETSFQSYADLPPGVVLEIYRHPHTQKYFVHLKSAPTREVQITLHYHFKPDTGYTSKEPFEPQELPADMKLSPALSEKLHHAVKKIPKLSFLSDEKLTTQEKLEKLRDYCGQFDGRTGLTSKASDGTLKQLLAIIKEQRGPCEERSQAFMLLAKYYLRLDVWLVGSETHFKCNIATKAGSVREIELGGGGSTRITGERLPNKELLSSLPKSVDITKLYEERIRQHLNTRNLFTWEDKTGKPALIKIPKGMSAQEAFFQPKQLQAFRTHYLNINGPAALNEYFEPYAERNGQRKKIDGPLKQIFNEGGLLQINFSNFSHEERSDLQSLFKIPPKFRGKPIPAGNKLKVIGFISEDITCSPKFLSHFNVCELPTFPKQPVSAPPKKTLSVDLFAAADWYTQLMGNLLFGKDQLHVTIGALREAIRQKSSLIIHRPPEDPKFKYFLDQIRLEKRFYFNGEWVEVPEDFTITLSQEALRKNVPEIKWANPNPPLPGEKIWLHLNNWYTLYEDLIYESDGSPRSVYGKLDQVAKSGKPTVFYVTETIPPLELERLALHIHTRYPGKAFTFQWAPGAGPHSTPAELKKAPVKNLIEHFKQVPGSKYCRTNDPGYIIAQLQLNTTPKPLVIDLTPGMGSSELLVSVTQKETKEDDPKLRYNLKKHALFEALEKGETVILKGEVDPGLMQELLPLFGDPPFLRINGTQKPVTGRVIIVEPKTAKHPVPALARPIVCDITQEDYARALLPPVPKLTDPKDLQDKYLQERYFVHYLLIFFEIAAYPHRGKTMPPDLGMTWERLLKMKQELQLAKDNKSPYRHKHNPLKPLMLNKYLKDDGTEYYQFLNVLCKFFFDMNPEHPIRLEKFKSLKKASEQHPREFTWRLLNTCNGATLREILGQIWPNTMKGMIQKSGGYYLDYWKNLSEPEWKKISDKLQLKANEAQKKVIEKPLSSSISTTQPALEMKADLATSKMDKMAGRLKYLIDEDPNAKVIVIQGEPGVGKTHFLHLLEKQTEKYSCTVGLKNFKVWLKDKTPGKKKLFLLDELNTEEPGMLAILEGIHRDPPGVFFEDEWYPLDPDQIIVAAINPEYIEGRYFHDLLLKGKTECLKLPDEAFLKQWLLTLCADIEIHENFAKDVLSVANFYKKQRPQEGYSLRDLQSLVQRYRILRLEAKAESPQQTLFSACQGEFALRISDPKKQQAFIKDAAQLFGFPTKIAADDKGIMVGTQWFPAEMAPAHEAIRQALLIRDRVMEQKEAKSNDAQLAYKRGFLLQGAPSIGKLNLCENMLKTRGIRYHVASTTDPNFRELAKAAFKDKAVLLLKDMHFLQSSDEKFLGDLLMGECEGVKASEPGFFILGLKTLDTNTNSLSSALCNRMQVLTVAPYSNDSWQKLAKRELAIPAHAEPFVQALFHPSRPYPKPVNASTFFKCARDRNLHEFSGIESMMPIMESVR